MQLSYQPGAIRIHHQKHLSDATDMTVRKFGELMGDWVRYVLSCCDRGDEEEKPVLQISGPTNFRRHDVKIEGLTEEQQAFIRHRAEADAKRMWDHLQPLHSSPSTQFAERPSDPTAATTTNFPTYEDFITPREAPPANTSSIRASGGGHHRSVPSRSSHRSHASTTSPVSARQQQHPASSSPVTAASTSQQQPQQQQQPTRLDRVWAHGRRISDSLRNSFVYSPVAERRTSRDGGRPYELRGLIEPLGRRSQGDKSDAGHSKDGSLSDVGKDVDVKF